jgi:hypothetical protein
MVEQEWKKLLGEALKDSGFPFSLSTAGCAPDSSTCFATFFDNSRKAFIEVKLSRDMFHTDATIKAEIVRQLSN